MGAEFFFGSHARSLSYSLPEDAIQVPPTAVAKAQNCRRLFGMAEAMPSRTTVMRWLVLSETLTPLRKHVLPFRDTIRGRQISDERFSTLQWVRSRSMTENAKAARRGSRVSIKKAKGLGSTCDTPHLATGVQSQFVDCARLELLAGEGREGSSAVKRIVRYATCLLLLVLAPGARGQVQVGDDLRMNLNGLLTGGYTGNYGNQIQSSHSLAYGGNATLSGSYYNPNFLNFTVNPYYDQSRANSTSQSLTDSSGVNASANFFTGSRFPGFASVDYTRNSTGTFGLIGGPNFTTVGNAHGFGVGWSVLLPDWPTFSVSYSQGAGDGTIFGTNEKSTSSTKTLNLRSTYQVAGWHLAALYTHLNINSNFPNFLGGEQGNNFSSSSGNNIGINGNHRLPWNGSVALTFNHSSYDGDYGSTQNQSNGVTSYTTNTETANFSFHPTTKLGLFVDQTYTDNLNGFLYQSIANTGGGVPLLQTNSNTNSSTMSGGAYYNFTKELYGQAQITYFNQTYLGKSYNGSYLTGTLGYNKRILDTFTGSVVLIESSNKFTNNNLGFVANLNAFRRFGDWQFSGTFSYAQNVQTLLVTYTTSYYTYNGNVHRKLGRGKQWTGVVNGTHSGFSQYEGTVNQSEGASTTLSLHRIDVNANYIQSRGQSLLTSTGIQPITTPGLPPLGQIVYNAKSYGGGITITPIPRLYISGTYSHATSDTLSPENFSKNKTDIFYGQLQYRLRKISILAGYTKYGQEISAANTSGGNQYSYFIGVTRWFNFF